MAAKKVDIFFVIDASGSMSPCKQAVLSNIGKVVGDLQQMSFQTRLGAVIHNVVARDKVRLASFYTQLNGDERSLIKANQLASIGKHADIVPFGKLPDVDMTLAEWNGEKGSRCRGDFVGLKDGASQAWDIAFCQILGRVADAAGLRIVEAEESRAESAC